MIKKLFCIIIGHKPNNHPTFIVKEGSTLKIESDRVVINQCCYCERCGEILSGEIINVGEE